MIDSADIHARIGAAWPDILAQLGIPGMGSTKGMPCPSCGGKDRFVGDNRHQRGDYFCRHCGAGDGFDLLMKVHRWNFSEARREVMAAAGIADEDISARTRWPIASPGAQPVEIARPTARVRHLMRSACAPGDVADVRTYLTSRHLWPLPIGCALKAHPLADYWDAGVNIGHFPALLAAVRDRAGELVTVHVTYLSHGRKLDLREPRKLLSPLTGRHGCAVRLLPIAGDVLGIAEGVETALAAYRLEKVATWAALSTALLGKFEPPDEVRRLRIYADRDIAGLEAAGRLMEHLQGRLTLELRTAPAPHTDWADVLRSRTGPP